MPPPHQEVDKFGLKWCEEEAYELHGVMVNLADLDDDPEDASLFMRLALHTANVTVRHVSPCFSCCLLLPPSQSSSHSTDGPVTPPPRLASSAPVLTHQIPPHRPGCCRNAGSHDRREPFMSVPRLLWPCAHVPSWLSFSCTGLL